MSCSPSQSVCVPRSDVPPVNTCRWNRLKKSSGVSKVAVNWAPGTTGPGPGGAVVGVGAGGVVVVVVVVVGAGAVGAGAVGAVVVVADGLVGRGHVRCGV